MMIFDDDTQNVFQSIQDELVRQYIAIMNLKRFSYLRQLLRK